MQKNEARLTVFFEDPFWVGVYEREDEHGLQACKILFGAAPKDYEVYQCLLLNWQALRFGPALKPDAAQTADIKNPKRMQREIRRQLSAQGAGTKAQQALKLQQAEGKLARRRKSREQKEQEAQHKFQLRQEKKREKHRGH